jgi:hypothetical protein
VHLVEYLRWRGYITIVQSDCAPLHHQHVAYLDQTRKKRRGVGRRLEDLLFASVPLTTKRSVTTLSKISLMNMWSIKETPNSKHARSRLFSSLHSSPLRLPGLSSTVHECA